MSRLDATNALSMTGLSRLRSMGALDDRFGATRLIAGGNSGDEQRAFSEVLGVARGHNPDATPEQRRGDAREAAEKLVASTFIEPLMKMARESDRTVAPFGATPAEKQFRGLMDARVAESIVRRSGFGLVDRVTDELVRAAGLGEATGAVEGSGS